MKGYYFHISVLLRVAGAVWVLMCVASSGLVFEAQPSDPFTIGAILFVVLLMAAPGIGAYAIGKLLAKKANSGH